MKYLFAVLNEFAGYWGDTLMYPKADKVVRILFIWLIIGVIAIMPAYAQDIGSWTFNEGSGTWANDTSGFNNNGTITGATWTTDALNGNALNFTGTSSISIPSINVTQFTLNVWVKLPNVTQSAVIIRKSNGTMKYGLDVGGEFVTARVYDGTVNGYTCSWQNDGTISADKWAMLSGEYDGNNLSLYINNILKCSTQVTTTISNENDNIYVGKKYDNTNYLTGILDEIQIYNYALNSSERTTLYQQFQPILAYPTGGITIQSSYPPQTTTVNFSWYDTQYPSDELIVSKDSSFNQIVVDVIKADDYYSTTLDSGETYYWKIKQYNSGSFGTTSTTESFSISQTLYSYPTTAAIQGVVYEFINEFKTPVSGATVYLYNTTFSQTQITGSNGYYLFSGLTNSTTYSLYASKQGYDTTVTLPVTSGVGTTATNDILMKIYISPYVPNFVFESFVVRGLFDNTYPGVTVNVYKDSDLTASFTGTTDSIGQVVFQLIKDQRYRVTFSGGGIGSDVTVYIFAKEESYLIRIMSGFPTTGDRATDILTNLTPVPINATWSNLELIYNDTKGSTTQVWFYAKNLSTGETCYQSSVSNLVTLQCPVIASGTYQFGFNATSSSYGFFQEDKIINFGAGNTNTPPVSTGIDKTTLQWVSIILIVLTASLFSIRTIKFGALIVPLEAIVFWTFGWFEAIPNGGLVANGVILSTAVTLGVMVYMRQSEVKTVY